MSIKKGIGIMKTRNMMVLTGALLVAGGTTMFAMGSESVEGTETKTECRAQGGKGRGEGGKKSCGDSKARGEGQRKYRNREGRGEGDHGRKNDSGRRGRYSREGRGEGHHGRKDNDSGRKGRYSRQSRGEHQSGRRNMQRGQMLGKMLNLTEEQQAQVKVLKEKNSAQVKASHQALRDAHKALREASQAETIDEAKIRQLSKNLADNMADAAIARSKGMKAFKALLTKEQQAKLAAKKAEFIKRIAAMKSKRAAVRAKNIKKATE